MADSPEKQELLKSYFVNYSPRLTNYAVRFVTNRETAQDIVQDCFMHLWEKMEQFSFIHIKALLFTMVRNRCLNYLKHRDVVDLYTGRYLHEVEGEERIYHYDFDFGPGKLPLYEELEKQLQIAVDSLPEKCRKVFVMSRFDGFKNREIAQKLNISTTSVEKHIRKALSSLTAYFEKKYPFHIYIIVFSCLLSTYLD